MKKEQVPTPDEIWQILKRVSLAQEKDKEATERRIKETDRRMEEMDRLFRESKQEDDRRKQEADRLFRESKQEDDRRKQEADRRKQEDDRRRQEADRRMEEMDRLFRESKQEDDRRKQEADRQTQDVKDYIKQTSREVRQLKNMFSNKWGELVESLVSGSLLKILKERNIKVTGLGYNMDISYTLPSGQKKQCEIDIIARNGEEIVAVEVKSTLGVDEVNRFLETLKQFTLFFPEYKGRKIYGAVAYLKLYQEAHLYAMRKGLFVIKATGDSAHITNPREFKPLDFSPEQ